MAVYVFSFPKYKVNEIFCAVAGLAYVVVLMSFIYKVRMLNDGLYIIPLIFICAWGNDTLRLLCWHAYWQAQDVPETQSEEKCRRLYRRYCRCCAPGTDLRTYFWSTPDFTECADA